jgi:sensor histidine kinase regulating citrate/malate metabolism
MIASFQIACATCQVNTAEGGGDAAGWSILFLLVVILMVLAGVATLMMRLIRKDNQALDPELCDHYVSSSVR